MKRTVLKFKMETGDHSNGASPKSLTSRGNFVKSEQGADVKRHEK